MSRFKSLAIGLAALCLTASYGVSAQVTSGSSLTDDGIIHTDLTLTDDGIIHTDSTVADDGIIHTDATLADDGIIHTD